MRGTTQGQPTQQRQPQAPTGRPLTQEEAEALVEEMEARAEAMPETEFSPENWIAAFGEDGRVQTPLGTVKMGENQISKLFLKNRTREFGMIKPTLENPDVIIEKKAPEEGAERQTKFLFVKTFKKADGGRIVYFESVTVRQEGMEVSISSHEAGSNTIKKEMQNETILHLDKKLSFGSERYLTETPSSEGPDLVPTSDNSTPKDTQSSDNTQDPVQTAIDDAVALVGEDGALQAVESTLNAKSKEIENVRKKIADAVRNVDLTNPKSRETLQKLKAKEAELRQKINTYSAALERLQNPQQQGQGRRLSMPQGEAGGQGSPRNHASGEQGTQTEQPADGGRGTGSNGEWDRTPISRSQIGAEIRSLIEYARKTADRVKRIVISKVTQSQQSAYEQAGIIGITENYVHSMESSAFRHYKEEHGHDGGEQIPLTEEEFANILDVIESFDEVKKGHKTPQGLETIIYKKDMGDGTIFYVEEIRTGRNSLAFKTAYKKRSSSSDGLLGKSPRPLTSKTTPDTTASENKDTQSSETNNTYTIEPAQYVTKRGKVLDMFLVKFPEPLTKERQQAAKETAKSEKGWYDHKRGGFMMRTEESTRKLAETTTGNVIDYAELGSKRRLYNNGKIR